MAKLLVVPEQRHTVFCCESCPAVQEPRSHDGPDCGWRCKLRDGALLVPAGVHAGYLPRRIPKTCPLPAAPKPKRKRS